MINRNRYYAKIGSFGVIFSSFPDFSDQPPSFLRALPFYLGLLTSDSLPQLGQAQSGYYRLGIRQEEKPGGTRLCVASSIQPDKQAQLVLGPRSPAKIDKKQGQQSC